MSVANSICRIFDTSGMKTQNLAKNADLSTGALVLFNKLNRVRVVLRVGKSGVSC